jgi:hypothetical protein
MEAANLGIDRANAMDRVGMAIRVGIGTNLRKSR